MTKQTNEMRYKTAEERVKAFGEFCRKQKECSNCKIENGRDGIMTCDCMAYWLALEADDEKPENCPFCGGKTKVVNGTKMPYTTFAVKCANDHCGYLSCIKVEKEWAISAHNRVARAVRAAKESEVK